MHKLLARLESLERESAALPEYIRYTDIHGTQRRDPAVTFLYHIDAQIGIFADVYEILNGEKTDNAAYRMGRYTFSKDEVHRLYMKTDSPLLHLPLSLLNCGFCWSGDNVITFLGEYPKDEFTESVKSEIFQLHQLIINFVDALEVNGTSAVIFMRETSEETGNEYIEASE